MVTPDLPSSGASPGHMSFDADVEVVRSAVESLLNHGKDVVVATHSYGGVPGTQSLKGFAKKDRVAQHGDQIAGVIALLYIAAFMALPGESVQSIGTKGEVTHWNPKISRLTWYCPSRANYICHHLVPPPLTAPARCRRRCVAGPSSPSTTSTRTSIPRSPNTRHRY